MIIRQLRIATLACITAASAPHAGAQAAPLAPPRERGQSVTPVFEGWFRNPDGTYSLSFGYFNRNLKEALDIPVGPANQLQPAPPDSPQPTHFEPRRHWGVFAVTVPADFGANRVVWTIVSRGDSVSIPGSLRKGWEIDALQGEAGSGNTPPAIGFTKDGPRGAGPRGLTSERMVTSVGQPLTLTVYAADDGKRESSIVGMGPANEPVKVMWFTHAGPATAAFSDVAPKVVDGTATTTVTFPAPGSYVLRVRANDASGVVGAGHAQCCWTNGFVKVTVTP